MEARARADALSLTVRPFFGYWVINVSLDYLFLSCLVFQCNIPRFGPKLDMGWNV